MVLWGPLAPPQIYTHDSRAEPTSFPPSLAQDVPWGLDETEPIEIHRFNVESFAGQGRVGASNTSGISYGCKSQLAKKETRSES